MRRRVNVIVGAACGLLCVAGILSYASDLRAEVEEERAAALARYGGEQVEILVATDDVAVGDMLDSTNAEKRLWLSELVPDGAVSDMGDVAASPVTSPIYAGEVVLERRFDEDASVALQVPDGKCAVSVPSKSVSAVGGSVGPGSRVDVYSASGAATDLLASRVLVLSTSATSEGKDPDEKADVAWVTLAVDPDLVEELIAAAQKSELYFSLPAEGLRPFADDAAGESSGLRSEGSDGALPSFEEEGALGQDGGSRPGAQDDEPATLEAGSSEGNESIAGDARSDSGDEG